MTETKSFFRKALDAIIEGRERQAQYHIDRYNFARRDLDKPSR
ncbi:hypothetical protein SAMN02983003_1308 [Devosia enhydra]|uniref:Uncharacterized protein n=1 Tax=Devosia enhydra TaxID=665118 RepID=A0A1K2HVM2_9HYPH|nr:hypothetical protein [Devosia enhydra]SFZ82842.1 hypothetical protein SAMN02983003_1308 [Devosia enhydra]